MRPERTTQRPRLVQIQRNTPGSQDSFGTPVDNWQKIADAWVYEWNTPGGREFLAAEQIKAQVTHELVIRYMSSVTVTTTDRVVYGTKKLDINAISNEGEQNRWLRLFCQEAA